MKPVILSVKLPWIQQTPIALSQDPVSLNENTDDYLKKMPGNKTILGLDSHYLPRTFDITEKSETGLTCPSRKVESLGYFWKLRIIFYHLISV